MAKKSNTTTIDEVSKLASTSTVAALSGHDRSTVKKRLLEVGISPRVDRGNETLYFLPEAMQALIRFESGASSSDIRNIAQARKSDAETRKLEPQYAFTADEPIAWMEDLFSMLNEVVQEMPCDDERKQQFVEKLQAIPGKVAKKYETESD